MSCPAPPLKYAVLFHVAHEGAFSLEFDTYEDALEEYVSTTDDKLGYYERVELIAVFQQKKL